MIISYRLKNFYSIGCEGVTINFGVDGNSPKTDLFIDKGEVAGRISLIESVIGPNASGKTRILQGSAFIKYLIVSSYSYRPLSPIPYESHYSSRNKPSEISIKFIVDKRVFEYFFAFEAKKIIREDLKEYSRTRERVTSKTLASRKWDKERETYILIDKELGLSNVAELRRNASMVASAMQKDSPSPLAKLIFDYWNNNVFMFNLWNHGNMEDSTFASDKLLNKSLHRLLDDKNTLIHEKVKETLSKYDIGFNDFFKHEFELPIPTENKRVVYGISHKFLDKEFITYIEHESSGTKRMVVILDSIMNALSAKNGGIAVVDEIDAFLHPEIVEAFVDLFTHPETNPYKVQLLFSTHNHRILKFLDSRQIILVEKNNHGSTEAWRLDEMQGVKSTDNYYTKYITGAYGARPKITP